MWRRLYARFILNEVAFKAHYHKRSNVETTFSMVKGKFGDSILAKSDTGQVNEVLLKFLCQTCACLSRRCTSWGLRRRSGLGIRWPWLTRRLRNKYRDGNDSGERLHTTQV